MLVIQVAAGQELGGNGDGVLSLSSAVMATSRSETGLKVVFPHVENGDA